MTRECLLLDGGHELPESLILSHGCWLLVKNDRRREVDEGNVVCDGGREGRRKTEVEAEGREGPSVMQ